MATYPDIYTKLLLHFNGTNGSQTLIEAGGKPVTAVENAQLDTSQKKFGSASLKLDGFGDYTDTPDHDDFDIGMSEFAIDFWVRFNTLPPAYQVDYFCSHGDSDQDRWAFYVYNNGSKYDIYFVANEGETQTVVAAATNLTLNTGTWFHIALTSKAEAPGRRFRIFVDGSQKVTGDGTYSTSPVPHPTGNFRIGSRYGYEGFLDGWIDEFRFSVGTFRWAANFTVPTEEYHYIANFSGIPFDLTGSLVIDIPAFDLSLSLVDARLNENYFDFEEVPFSLVSSMVSDIPHITSGGEWAIPSWELEGSARAVTSYGGFEIPAWMLEGLALAGVIGRGDLQIPKWELAGHGGGSGDLTIPLWRIEGSGLVGAVGRGDLRLPVLALSGTGTVHGLAGGDLKIPLWIMEGSGWQNQLGGGDLAIPPFELRGNGYAGIIGGGDFSIPIWTVSGQIVALASGGGDLSIPLWFIDGYGRVIPITEKTLPIVVNAANHAVTEYQNYVFNSLCKFNGVFLGASKNGIHKLEGDRDGASMIEAIVKTGIMDLWERVVKKPRNVWMSYRSTHGMIFFVEIGDEEKEIWEADEFPIVPDKIHEARTKFARGIKERFLTFGIKNKDGSDFDIENIRILGDMIPNRRR